MGKTVDASLKKFYRNIMKENPLFLPHQFIVTFKGADLPTIFECSPGDTQAFTYYVKSASIPQITIKEATVNFLSQDFVLPVGVQYGDTWNVNVLATNSMRHYVGLRNWMRIFADIEQNGGGSKVIPNVTAQVKLIDSTMQQELHEFVLEGIYPTQVPDLSMQYQNDSTIPEMSVQFTYQYMYRTDEGDPLAK